MSSLIICIPRRITSGWSNKKCRGCLRTKGKRNEYEVLVRKHERKKPLVINRRRWKGNNKMSLEEIEWENLN
jgi:hypothetical protein